MFIILDNNINENYVRYPISFKRGIKPSGPVYRLIIYYIVCFVVSCNDKYLT